MMNGRHKNPAARATIEQKVAWLLAHIQFWEAIPTDALYSDYRADYLDIARAWKDAGLLAPSTACTDAGIEEAIKRARLHLKRTT